MTLDESARHSAIVAEDAANRFSALFEHLDIEAVQRLTEVIRKLPSDGGRFQPKGTTTETLGRITSVLNHVLKQKQLVEAVNSLLPDFDRMGELATMVQRDHNDLRVTKGLLNDTKRRMVQMTLESIRESSYNSKFIIPVKRTLYNAVNFGATITETERAIRGMISGKNGLLQKYAGGVARDAMHQYEGQVHTEMALEHELTNWSYVGTILPGRLSSSGRRYGGTRPQCARWVKARIIHAEEIEDELIWAVNNGSGLIPGTAPATFAIFRGGYNCRHKAIPTRRE